MDIKIDGSVPQHIVWDGQQVKRIQLEQNGTVILLWEEPNSNTPS